MKSLLLIFSLIFSAQFSHAKDCNLFTSPELDAQLDAGKTICMKIRTGFLNMCGQGGCGGGPTYAEADLTLSNLGEIVLVQDGKLTNSWYVQRLTEGDLEELKNFSTFKIHRLSLTSKPDSKNELYFQVNLEYKQKNGYTGHTLYMQGIVKNKIRDGIREIETLTADTNKVPDRSYSYRLHALWYGKDTETAVVGPIKTVIGNYLLPLGLIP